MRGGPSVDAGFDARYQLPEKFFFYPAQLYRHKNHRALVAAIALMKDTHPDVNLVLVGATERNGYDDLRALVEAKGLTGHVQFLGYVPDSDMPGFYGRARALVMPTFFGPTNIPPLEAFEAGCPVATSRIYGIPDQLGDAALYFDPRSVEEMHDCLVRLWQDDALCADLAERGREHARRWGPVQFGARFREIIGALI
jgi:glycosyltransferase involved in cell wall biosynthesis